MTQAVGGRGRVWAVAALAGLVVFVCALMSHRPAATPATMSPAQALPEKAVSLSVNAVADPAAGVSAARLAGVLMAGDDADGSCSAHACTPTMSGRPSLITDVAAAAISSRDGHLRGDRVFASTGYPEAARGAPSWTVLTRSQLSVIRV